VVLRQPDQTCSTVTNERPPSSSNLQISRQICVNAPTCSIAMSEYLKA
jgi:hypothetical protein